MLVPHPAVRWCWFEGQPIYSIWRRNREAQTEQESEDAALDWIGEGALLTRPAGRVRWTALNAAGCVFLDACAAACPLAQAADQALAQQPGTDLAPLMATLLEAGAFCSAHV